MKTFDELIMGQSSSNGYWTNEALVLSFILNLDDLASLQTIKDQILSLINNPSEIDKVWLTMLAIYLFENKFEDRGDEWKLIA